MPNIDKMIKTTLHELAEGKAVIRETMTAALRNQEIVIAQNKRIITLLEQIKIQPEAAREELAAETASSAGGAALTEAQ